MIIKKNKSVYIYLSLCVLCLVTLFAFWPGLHVGFTNWDDPDYIQTNTCIHNLNADNIVQMFTKPAVSNYHPLTLLSLGIDYSRAKIDKLTGLPDPYPFHQTNIILHIFNVLLVFLVIYKLSKKKIAVAFFTAFLFAVHPMHVESVAWISERKDVLFGFFFLISMFFYLKYIDNKFIWGYWLSLIFFVLSLLSKPAAAPMGLILLLIDYYRGRFNLKGFRLVQNIKLIGEKIPFFILGFVVILITYFIQSKTNTVADFQLFSLFQRLLISFYGFYMYLQKLVLPINLSVFYPYPFKNIHDSIPAAFYMSFVISIIILVFSFLSVKKTRTIMFGVLFYLIMLIPVLQFVSVGSAIISERYTYIPYIGIFFMVGMGLYQITYSKEGIFKKQRLPVIILVLIYMGVTTVVARERTQVWTNSETLWTNVIEQFPDVSTAYKNRGNYYASEAHETDKALKDYEKLMTLDSTDASAYSNLGNIYTMKEQYTKAIAIYSRSIQLDSTMHKIPQWSSYSYNNYTNRGYAYMKTHQLALAIKDYTLLINKYPNDEKLHFNRGLALANTGLFMDAKADFLDCLKLDVNSPNHSAALYNLASCYIRLGDMIQALSYLKQAQSAGYQVDDAYIKTVESQMSKK